MHRVQTACMVAKRISTPLHTSQSNLASIVVFLVELWTYATDISKFLDILRP